METQFSLGAVHNNELKRKSAIAEHDHRLQAALTEACEDAGLPDGKASAIIEGGMQRFTISADGTVKPLSSFPTIDDFIQHHRNTAPDPVTSARKAADNKAMHKTELYEQLKYYADVGDMKAYRAARAEYATL